ncbi:SpoIIE family protein phosphatase [Streptomyces sp. SL13]|uniref:protein-serine/threonine phosphatase n=1 Tax=Streptantibioticus silvisoli TaxID=2705255 RepID=A0AA90KGZ0_9ACTN|nr:SpoIIE family protein phosphatase [Streptantibioticus silvisoli]MDI5970844.1 SpoIIE family protein phosphatase [Streptantibioticus silvisoli]
MSIASFALDHAGRISAWSADARSWFGHSSAEALGRHYDLLIAEAPPGAPAAALGAVASGDGRVMSVTLRDGSRRDALLTCSPLAEPGGTTGLLCQIGEMGRSPRSEVQSAFADALMRTSPFGLGVLDNELRYVMVNDALAEFNGMSVGDHLGSRVGEVVRAADGGEYEKHLRGVLETGEPLHNVVLATRSQGRRDRDKAWSVSFFRLTGREGQVLGLGGLIVDVTQKETALLDASAVRQRLALVNQAGSKVGTTLELAETARELTAFAVPEFADAASVEVREDFLGGGRFRSTDRPVSTVRLAGRSVLEDAADRALFADDRSEHLYPVGSRTHDTVRTGRPWLSDDVDAADLADLDDPGAPARPPGRNGLGSLITAPLLARGRCLGLVRFGRSSHRDPLDADDLKLAEELATRTALSLDNARMYEEERRIAVALQRDMLPGEHEITGRPGLEVASHYRSTSRSAKVGGDWFDVIPLSGHRVALVVGDMMGHDIQAAAGMGQLRTAMHTLARLDLEPVDLLTRLDDIVQNSPAMQHATCVYAVYNTVTRACGIVNAGHPPPVLRHRDGSTEIVAVDPGVPLGIGLGGTEFAVVDIELPEDSTLVLYTDGLIERRGEDIEVGIESLRSALGGPAPAGEALQELCDGLVTALVDLGGDDDLAVLMARAPSTPEHCWIRCKLPPEPRSVPLVRDLVRRTLHDWDLDALRDTVELLMSELVTNSVRHARGQVEIQMARGETLVVEVADDDERLPHLTRAADDDERGRGLTLVGDIAAQWGARSIDSGKVVWFELPLPAPDGGGPPVAPSGGRSPAPAPAAFPETGQGPLGAG